MPLVKAICTNCGGTLEVDKDKDAAICPFCNTAYIVEKAIQQFQISNTNYIENATFINGETEERLLERGLTQIEMDELEAAEETFQQMTQKYPENYKGWLGLYVVNSDRISEDDTYEKYRRNAILQCPESKKDELGNAVIYSEKKLDAISEKIKDLEKKKASCQRSIRNVSNRDSFKAFVGIAIVLIVVAIVFITSGNKFGYLAAFMGIAFLAGGIYKAVTPRDKEELERLNMSSESLNKEISMMQGMAEVIAKAKKKQEYIAIMKN